jgi:cell division septal protein FtsQ
MSLFKRHTSRKKRYARAEGVSLYKHLLIGFLSIGGVLLLGVLLWYGTRLPEMTISTVSTVGGETIAHSEVQLVVEEQLRGSYARIIPHRFVYLYPKKQILASLESVPRLHSPTIERIEGNELVVTFKEYVPHALWCADISETGECYFLDESGYAFAPAPPLKGGVFIRFIAEERDPAHREFITEEATLATAYLLLDMIEEQVGFVTTNVTFTNEGDLLFHVSHGGYFKISPQVPTEESVQNIVTILDSEEFAHLKEQSFDYIDVRFGNRVFVKEEQDVPDDSVATSSEYILETFTADLEPVPTE